VTDSVVTAAELTAGVTTTEFRSEDYIFGAAFTCGPGYREVTDAATGVASCAACGAGRGLHSFTSQLNLSRFGHTSRCPPV